MGNVIKEQGGPPVEVTFYGVRGSCPCPCEENRRYGGNTACVSVAVEGHDPILFDLGTGLRRFGLTQPADGSFRGVALMTHLHWDHVQGLPFFPPVDRAGARLDVYGPRQEVGSLGEAFGDLMRPPYFPVRFDDLRGDICFHDVETEDLAVGDAKIKVRPIPHNGPTVGYRVELDGTVITYISDHQAPRSLQGFADEALELADGADLLIHDAQYTPEEFAQRSHWGHCTVDYAVRLAAAAGVRQLALFHHDPAHDDDALDRLLVEARRLAAGLGDLDVLAAREGQCLVY
jgi:phosphoribosyl 1,2-cyclic phosphodiesterase